MAVLWIDNCCILSWVCVTVSVPNTTINETLHIVHEHYIYMSECTIWMYMYIHLYIRFTYTCLCTSGILLQKDSQMYNWVFPTHTLLSHEPIRTVMEPGRTAILERGWEQYVVWMRREKEMKGCCIHANPVYIFIHASVVGSNPTRGSQPIFLWKRQFCVTLSCLVFLSTSWTD